MRVPALNRAVLFSLTILVVTLPSCSRKGPEKAWIEQWSQTSPMILKRAGLRAASSGKWIYAIGGGEYLSNGLNIFDSVEYTEIQEDGQLGEWRFTASLKTPRIYLSSVVYNHTLYVMGGEGGISYTGELTEESPRLLNTIERAKIKADGSLEEWVLEEQKMHYPRRGGALFAHNGWLYAVGGYNGIFRKDIEKARIKEDGSLDPWIIEEGLTTLVRYIAGYVQNGNGFFILGGHLHSPEMALNKVEMTAPTHTSALTGWRETAPMNTRRFLNTSVLMGKRIYVMAGQNTVTLTSTEHADLLEDGQLEAWVHDTPLNTPRRAAGAIGSNNRIYVLGGMYGPIGQALPVNSVEFSSVIPGKNLGHWSRTDSADYESYQNQKKSMPRDSRAHLNQALQLLSTEQHKTILFNVSEAIRIDPSNFHAYNVRADVYYRMGKVDLSIGEFEKSLAIEKENFDALMGIGNIDVKQGEFSEAIHYYERAILTLPESEIAHESLGNVYFHIGNYDGASREFKWVLNQNPDSSHARDFLNIIPKNPLKIPSNVTGSLSV